MAGWDQAHDSHRWRARSGVGLDVPARSVTLAGPVRLSRLAPRNELLPQDVGMTAVLCELAQHLCVDGPRRALASCPVDCRAEWEIGANERDSADAWRCAS